jgi:tRNA-Thr(GGU) m(6)t(6)A37 methyltransferase TsaA
MPIKGAEMRAWLIFGLCLVAAVWPGEGAMADKQPPAPEIVPRDAPDHLQMLPIGVVERQGERIFLRIRPELVKGLDGLKNFSHLWVLYWFHGNDRPEERAILQVHPRRNPENPLTGVFATRAPVRPNLIGMCACRIVAVKGNLIEVADLDALDGSPILDLKPYIPKGDAIPEAKTPAWLDRPAPDVPQPRK